MTLVVMISLKYSKPKKFIKTYELVQNYIILVLMIIIFDFQISETELNDKVTAALKLDDTQSTVSIRATLAQEYVKASSDQTRVCEMLIHDQHLQVSDLLN